MLSTSSAVEGAGFGPIRMRGGAEPWSMSREIQRGGAVGATVRELG